MMRALLVAFAADVCGPLRAELAVLTANATALATENAQLRVRVARVAALEIENVELRTRLAGAAALEAENAKLLLHLQSNVPAARRPVDSHHSALIQEDASAVPRFTWGEDFLPSQEPVTDSEIRHLAACDQSNARDRNFESVSFTRSVCSVAEYSTMTISPPTIFVVRAGVAQPTRIVACRDLSASTLCARNAKMTWIVRTARSVMMGVATWLRCVGLS